MNISVIIPVWNGEAEIGDCLEALFAHSDDSLREVICVDNASQDNSAHLIGSRFPQVRLLQLPVNLGFAGGVNHGIRAATGDATILLNQDCLVGAGWLSPLLAAFKQDDRAGILGGTIFDRDGSVNHCGAYLRLPDAYGRHETAPPGGQSQEPRDVDYVTGALFAIRANVWDEIGPFDEEFYPAYYEEVDYCYRARRHGFRIMHVPATEAVHYFTGSSWRDDPLKHAADQHFARYRFVSKHFSVQQLQAFFTSEAGALTAETHLDQLRGRFLGARAVLRALPAIGEARQRDLGEEPDPVRRRLLQVEFYQLLRAIQRAQPVSALAPSLDASEQQLAAIRREKDALLDRIFFRPSNREAEGRWRRWWRTYVRRPLSILTLRDYRLLARLNTLHDAHLAQLTYHTQLMAQEADDRLQFLTTLASYDYR